MANLRWNGNGANRHVEERLRRALSACAIVVASEAKRLISVAGTGQTRDQKTGKFRRSYGANPSAPGEPPHKQTGRLRASVTWELAQRFGGLVARVGTNVIYGKYLELGTKRMAARPWLRRALAQSHGRVNDILRRAGGGD